MNLLQQALQIIEDSPALHSRVYPDMWVEIYTYNLDKNWQTFQYVSQSGQPNDGADLQVVVSVDIPNHGEVFVACDGTYSSWTDCSFGAPYLAKAEQVLVTLYKPLEEN